MMLRLLLLSRRIIVLLLLIICLLIDIDLLLRFINIEIIFLLESNLLFQYVQHLISRSVFC